MSKVSNFRVSKVSKMSKMPKVPKVAHLSEVSKVFKVSKGSEGFKSSKFWVELSVCMWVCMWVSEWIFSPKLEYCSNFGWKFLLGKNWPKFGSITKIWENFCCPKHVFSEFIKNNYQICEFKILGGFSIGLAISVNNYSFLTKCFHSQKYLRKLAFAPNLGHCPKFEICNCPKFGAMTQNSAIPDW